MKKQKYNDVVFTVRDALKHSHVFMATVEIDPAFLGCHAVALAQSFTHQQVALTKYEALVHLRGLIADANVGRFAFLLDLPEVVLYSLPTLETIFRDPSVLDRVKEGKLSYEGLVKLVERGTI